MNNLLIIFFVVFFISKFEISHSQNNEYDQFKSPVFKLDTSRPTMDKPQSKLFYLDGLWYAILPGKSGPSLWKRSNNGWIEQKDVTESLLGIPGRIDVFEEDSVITAVGVDSQYLTVFTIIGKKLNTDILWETKICSNLYPSCDGDKFETATITKHKSGRFWVAATAGKKVCVWYSDLSNKNWTGPDIIAEGINEDDICTITSLPEGVGVIWSDQENDALKFKLHIQSNEIEIWEETEVIIGGGNIANDHLNTTLSSDSTLWLVSKNSVDEVGKPQLVICERTKNGNWSHYQYAYRNANEAPSRPIIISVEESPELILSGHTIYNFSNRYLGKIVFGWVDTESKDILKHTINAIQPDTAFCFGSNRINDVTGYKKPYPKGVPWIILASDLVGNIYEADVAQFFR